MIRCMTNSRLGRFLFHNTSTAQTIVKNTFWLSFGEIIGRLLRAITIILAARILGASGWGTLSYMTSLAAVLTVFSDVGISGVLIREAAKNEGARQAYFATSSAIKLALIGVSLCLILFGADLIAGIPISRTLIYATGILFVFDSLRRFGTTLFRAEERMEVEALINIITQALIMGLGLAALFLIPSPESLAIAYAAGAGVGLIVAACFLRKYVSKIFSEFSKSLIKPIISAAWPMTLASVFGILLVNIDMVMIGWFYSAADVGLYSAAQKPITLLYILPSFIVGGLFPTLSRLTQRGAEEFNRALVRSLSSITLAAYPIVVGIVLTADQIVSIFYGGEYLKSAVPLGVLALSLLATFPVTVIIHAIFVRNRQKEMVPIWTIGSVANVGLNLYLIPAVGITGAAIASLITQYGTGIFMWRKIRQISDFSLKGRLAPPLKASILMGVIIVLMRFWNISFFVLAPVAFVVYAAGLHIFRDITLREIRGMFRK